MGYESKIIVVERHVHDTPDGETWVYGSEIARFDLSKMGYEKVWGADFPDMFTEPIDFDLYNMGGDSETTREDCYGEHCKWAALVDIIEWLEQSETGKEYRRAKLFLDFCKALQSHKDEYGQIVLVHYGY